MAVVVLPTPPFWFAMQKILAIAVDHLSRLGNILNLEITQIHSVMEMPLRGNGMIGDAKNNAGQVAWDHYPERMDLRMIATMVLVLCPN